MDFLISNQHINPFILIGLGFLIGVLGGFFGVGGSFLAGPALFAIGLPMNMVLEYFVPILTVPVLMLFKYGKQRGYLLDWVLFHTKPHVYSALERDREMDREYIKD